MKIRGNVYVASEQLTHAVEFAKANGVERHNLVWLGRVGAGRGRNDIREIWVIGEIGQQQAEEIHLLEVYSGCKVRFADPDERVTFEQVPPDAA
jgi:hypothetical protein